MIGEIRMNQFPYQKKESLYDKLKTKATYLFFKSSNNGSLDFKNQQNNYQNFIKMICDIFKNQIQNRYIFFLNKLITFHNMVEIYSDLEFKIKKNQKKWKMKVFNTFSKFYKKSKIEQKINPNKVYFIEILVNTLKCKLSNILNILQFPLKQQISFVHLIKNNKNKKYEIAKQSKDFDQTFLQIWYKSYKYRRGLFNLMMILDKKKYRVMKSFQSIKQRWKEETQITISRILFLLSQKYNKRINENFINEQIRYFVIKNKVKQKHVINLIEDMQIKIKANEYNEETNLLNREKILKLYMAIEMCYPLDLIFYKHKQTYDRQVFKCINEYIKEKEQLRFEQITKKLFEQIISKQQSKLKISLKTLISSDYQEYKLGLSRLSSIIELRQNMNKQKGFERIYFYKSEFEQFKIFNVLSQITNNKLLNFLTRIKNYAYQNKEKDQEFEIKMNKPVLITKNKLQENINETQFTKLNLRQINNQKLNSNKIKTTNNFQENLEIQDAKTNSNKNSITQTQQQNLKFFVGTKKLLKSSNKLLMKQALTNLQVFGQNQIKMLEKLFKKLKRANTNKLISSFTKIQQNKTTQEKIQQQKQAQIKKALQSLSKLFLKNFLNNSKHFYDRFQYEHIHFEIIIAQDLSYQLEPTTIILTKPDLQTISNYQTNQQTTSFSHIQNAKQGQQQNMLNRATYQETSQHQSDQQNQGCIKQQYIFESKLISPSEQIQRVNQIIYPQIIKMKQIKDQKAQQSFQQGGSYKRISINKTSYEIKDQVENKWKIQDQIEQRRMTNVEEKKKEIGIHKFTKRLK